MIVSVQEKYKGGKYCAVVAAANECLKQKFVSQHKVVIRAEI